MKRRIDFVDGLVIGAFTAAGLVCLLKGFGVL